MNHIQGVPREQVVLFPEAVDDYIMRENPVRFLEAFVEGIDLVRLGFRSMRDESGRLTRYHLTPACRSCPLKPKCTRGEQRRITRWIHEDVLDRMRQRVRQRPNIMKLRREIVEHPFGTLIPPNNDSYGWDHWATWNAGGITATS